MSDPSSPQVNGFRPKNGAILASGVILGLSGLMLCVTGCLTLVQAFAWQHLAKADPKAMGELAGLQELMWSASLINLAVYGGIGILFLFVAYGCFAFRRWARPFALTLAWGWLYLGGVMTISLAVTMGALREAMVGSMDRAVETAGGETATSAIDGIFTVVMMVYFAFMLVFLILLPAAVLWLQWSKEVRLTLESRDPVLRWTDRHAAPLIGLTIGATVFAVVSLPGLLMMRAPWMRPFLPEGPLKYLWFLVPVVWASVAWGSYRRHIAAWILALLALAGSVVFGAASMNGIDWAAVYQGMGIPEKELAAMSGMMENLYTPAKLGLIMAASMLPMLAFLIWVLRYFRAASS